MDENIKTTEHGLKNYMKFGPDSHFKGIKSGDIVRYKPSHSRFYWEPETSSEPPKRKLTELKEYIVEYAYSSVIQVKCDTGRIVSYGSELFELFNGKEWIDI